MVNWDLSVGDLVMYRHDNDKTGIVVCIDFKRGEATHLVMWSHRTGQKCWFVSPDWIETRGVISESR